MAVLYKANETDFNRLGLGPLNDAVSILVTEERNGMFELEMTYPIEGSRFNDLKLERLIKADAGYNLKNQRFKIIRITKPIDGIVTVNAEHVSYLTQDLALKPTVNYSGSASQALNTWNNNIVDNNPFIVASDITTVGSGSWSIKEVKNAREALGGVSGSILETYGGEYRFDNYSIRLMAQRGVNSGALIAYGRNLVDLTQEESIADTFTSVYPYAVYQDDNNKEVLLTLPEYFIDSEYIGNYARRKILPVDFSSDEIKDVATLRSRAKSYIKSNGIGIPKVNMKIKYVDLAKTLDYKDLAILEEINLCDNVFVYFEQLGVNTSAKIIKTVWDDLLDQYDSIEVGEAKSSLSNSINATVDGKLETIVQRVNTIQLTADGLNVIYRGPNQPPPGNIGDLWYEPDGIYENMYQWDGSIWKLMLSTRNLNSVSEEVKKHTDEIADVTKSANDAVAKADQAIEDAGFIKLDVAQVKTDALTTASTAQSAYNNAISALNKADTAISTTDSFSLLVDDLERSITFKADSSRVDTISSKVDSQAIQIKANTDGLVFKAEKSAVDTINQTVNQHTNDISINAQAINARLTSTQVDSLVASKNYVNQTTLDATATSLSGSITQVNTALANLEIGGRNYLRNTRNMVNYDYWNTLSTNNMRIAKHSFYRSGSENMFVIANGNVTETTIGSYRVAVESGKKYTFSMQVFHNQYLKDFDIYFLGRAKGSTELFTVNTAKMGNVASSLRINKFTWTFTIPSGAEEGFIRIDNNGTNTSGQIAELYIAEMQLEKGEKTTDHSLAQEDLVTIEKFTTLEANVNGIQTTVGDKASQTQVTQLATQWNQTTALANGHTGQISNLGEQLNFRVTSTQVTDAILADKTIKDTRYDNQLPSWYLSNYPKQVVEELKIRTVIGVTGSATYGQLTTNVTWSDTGTGGFVQTFRSDDGTFQRTSNASANTWGNWDKIIEAGKLISQINLQSNNILIQSGKLYLDAASVVFSGNAFIPSAAITSLTVDKLNGGTANFANFDAININANSMTTGTLTGANYSNNLNTGVETFRNPTTGDSLQLMQGEIRFQNGAQGRYLKYQSEGLLLQPFASNTGTSKNTALHLIGGGPGSYQYIQFVSQDLSGVNMRLQAEGQNMTAFHGFTGSFIVSKYGDSTATGTVISGGYETRHPTGISLRIAGNSISTPRDGARDIYITPQGTGAVVSGAADGTRYNFVASDFVKQSSRDTKTNIVPLERGLDNIRQLRPVSYNKIDKLNQGIFEIEKGFIAEDSLMVATVDGKGIYDSHINAYLVKAVQELDVRTSSETDQLKEEVRQLKNRIQKLESAA